MLVVTAAALSIPLTLFAVMEYDINFAFALAPVIAWSYFTKLHEARNLSFTVAAACGVISILLANYLSPDGKMVRHFLALALILIAPSFLFLGREIIQHGHSLDRLSFWLSIFSSIFLIPVAGRLLLNGEAVRVGIGWQGYEVLNASFFGLPVFATFGILSLAYLICLQSMILCGSIMSGKTGKTAKAFFSAGLASGAFLVIGSDSRAAQLCLVWLIVTVTAFTFLQRNSWRSSLLVAAALLVAGGVIAIRGVSEMRIVQTAMTLVEMAKNDQPDTRKNQQAMTEEELRQELRQQLRELLKLNSGIAMTEKPADEKKEELQQQLREFLKRHNEIAMTEKPVDELTTGRSVLISAGAREVAAAPIIGNGFSTYERYTGKKRTGPLAQNTSTHIYYLTLIWKGGLLFFVPFMVFVALAVSEARQAKAWRSPEGFFAASTVLLAFGPMAFSWDILIVPSAGALAWFLLGALGRPFAMSHS